MNANDRMSWEWGAWSDLDLEDESAFFANALPVEPDR